MPIFYDAVMLFNKDPQDATSVRHQNAQARDQGKTHWCSEVGQKISVLMKGTSATESKWFFS